MLKYHPNICHFSMIIILFIFLNSCNIVQFQMQTGKFSKKSDSSSQDRILWDGVNFDIRCKKCNKDVLMGGEYGKFRYVQKAYGKDEDYYTSCPVCKTKHSICKTNTLYFMRCYFATYFNSEENSRLLHYEHFASDETGDYLKIHLGSDVKILTVYAKEKEKVTRAEIKKHVQVTINGAG